MVKNTYNYFAYNMLRHGKIMVCIAFLNFRIVFICLYLQQSNLELYRSINAKKKPVEKSEIGIDAVKKGGHCFIGGRVALLFGVSESCGEIRVAEEQFFSSSYAFVLPKLSPYKKAINFR